MIADAKIFRPEDDDHPFVKAGLELCAKIVEECVEPSLIEGMAGVGWFANFMREQTPQEGEDMSQATYEPYICLFVHEATVNLFTNAEDEEPQVESVWSGWQISTYGLTEKLKEQGYKIHDVTFESRIRHHEADVDGPCVCVSFTQGDKEDDIEFAMYLLGRPPEGAEAEMDMVTGPPDQSKG